MTAIPELIEDRLATPFWHPSYAWTKFEGNVYECRVLLCPEPEGGFSAIALRLPGVASQGETLEEALANIEEAFRATVACYLEDGGRIPWGDVTVERTKDCQERWILVNV